MTEWRDSVGCLLNSSCPTDGVAGSAGWLAFMLCAELMLRESLCRVARITVCVCVCVLCVGICVVNLCGMKQNMEPDLESQQRTTEKQRKLRNRIAHRRKQIQ
jgi:hypothetical protein